MCPAVLNMAEYTLPNPTRQIYGRYEDFAMARAVQSEVILERMESDET